MLQRLLLVVPLLLLFHPAQGRADEPLGRVTLAEGQVQRDAGGARTPLKNGDTLAEGDHILTGSPGRLELLLADGSVVRLGPSSDLTLAALAFVPETQTLTAKLHLALGKLWTHVEKVKAGGSYEVETDRAVAGVRGTEFRVDAAAEAHAIEVYEGRVHVKPVLVAMRERQGPSSAVPALAPSSARVSGELDLAPGERAAVAHERIEKSGHAKPDDFDKFARHRPLPRRAGVDAPAKAPRPQQPKEPQRHERPRPGKR